MHHHAHVFTNGQSLLNLLIFVNVHNNTATSDRNIHRMPRYNWDWESHLSILDPELELNPNRNAWRLYLVVAFLADLVIFFS